MPASSADTRAVTRSGSLADVDDGVPGQVDRLTKMAATGLSHGFDAMTGDFAQTVRAVRRPEGVALQREGTSLRYAAMAALGLSRATPEAQHEALGGWTVGDVVRVAAKRAETSADPGAVALAVWAVAEVERQYADTLVQRLRALVDRRAL